MRKRLYLLTLMLLSLTGSWAQQTINLDFGWKFHLGDIDSPKALSTVQGYRQLTAGWEDIDIPHDFQTELPWTPPAADERADNSDQASNVKSRLSARGFKEMSAGWYARTVNLDQSYKGKRIVLDFEGIIYTGDVYLNGKLIGGTDYGYLGFDIDISSLINYGQDNILAVKASTGEPNNSRWYTGGGLYRGVSLRVTDSKLYFARHPLYITTSGNHTVNIQAEVANIAKLHNIRIATDILGPDGKNVSHREDKIGYNRKLKSEELRLPPFEISSPQLWSPDSPALYTAVVSLLDADGNIVETTKSKFGIRTFEISPEYGLRLNGKKLLLKGNANHHTLGALGAAAYPRAMEKRLKLLKSFGFNHIRTSHNPYSESFLDLCDSLGLVVVDELYDKWLTQYTGGRKPWLEQWAYELPEWIKRDRNHPSIAIWSLGNELQTYANLPFGDWGVTPYRMMKPVLLRYDSTRPITVAMHPRGRSLTTDSIPAPLVFETDIASYNYRYMYFPGDSRRWPNMIFYQSEANTSNMGPNFFDMNLDRVIGLAYWGQIDYLGESNGWPAKGWAQGSFDISLQPKPIAYMLKSMFTAEPVVHIGVIEQLSEDNVWNGVQVGTAHMSENWNHNSGDKLSLYTYTNQPKVELIINGKSIGTKENTADSHSRNKIKWDNITYEPGYIEAIAYDSTGRKVSSHRLETTGKAVSLKVSADQEHWLADGYDLMHVRVWAVDSRGRRVWDAGQDVKFDVDGGAKIVAVSSGDITSDEPVISDHRHLFRGSAMAILRSDKSKGTVKLRVSAPGLGQKTIKLVKE